MEAVIKKGILCCLLMLLSAISIAHTIYAANDISLLDNRFRIDPQTEQVTIILNHPNNPQKIVLVQPDGSKLYAERHPAETVAWLSGPDQDIITIQTPMPGPWQAIATLHGNNRIKLLSPLTLQVEKLPLKIYQFEYLTTHVSLLQDSQVIRNKHYLVNARFSVSLTGDASQLIALYKDDGQNYDSLPFDGKLSTHLYIDLLPGRYLLNIKTKNNIFLRSYNEDVVVFPSPIITRIQQVEDKITQVKLTFLLDELEIDPNSVTIDALIKNENNGTSEQLIIHLADEDIIDSKMTMTLPLTAQLYLFSAKVFATSTDGREIIFELPQQHFELTPPFSITPSSKKQIIADKVNIEVKTKTITNPASYYLWLIIALISFLIVTITAVTIYLISRKQNRLTKNIGLSLDELTMDETNSTLMELNKVKK